MSFEKLSLANRKHFINSIDNGTVCHYPLLIYSLTGIVKGLTMGFMATQYIC